MNGFPICAIADPHKHNSMERAANALILNFVIIKYFRNENLSDEQKGAHVGHFITLLDITRKKKDAVY